MIWARVFVVVMFVASASCSRAGAAAPQTGDQLVVVELFESQGCSSCPPANANVNALSRRSDLLTLVYGVTYWDQLGWSDTFARPEFTQRQRDYARGLGNASVYTPQVVLNGRSDIVGNNAAELERTIHVAAQVAFRAHVQLTADAVTVSAADAAPPGSDARADVSADGWADVWLVRYDPRTLNVAIRAGENQGRTLPHTHVVRELRKLGRWSGGDHTYSFPANQNLSTAVMVQMPRGGAVIGAARHR